MAIDDGSRRLIEMREPCKACACRRGVVLERNGQDTVRCLECDRFAYNAPRVETGRAVRSVSTVHAAIKPKQRSRILERAGGKCEQCGARERLHVGHIVSVAIGLELGVDESLLNGDDNLLCQCEECNLGRGSEPMPLFLAVTVLRARAAFTEARS
jgi:hypothetical protein